MDKSYLFNTDFSGVLGEDYDLLKHICPTAIEMSHLVGSTIKGYTSATTRSGAAPLTVIELGCGTGITTLSLLSARSDILITAIDNEPTMLNQAKKSLADYVKSERLSFLEEDALSALSMLPDNSVDIIASAYTLHNFLNDYRNEVLEQCYRVLIPGGLFINGDRYGLDDISAHTALIQQEVSQYFKVLTALKRIDLLEHWIVHLFSDESQNHCMRESAAIRQMVTCGFTTPVVQDRNAVSALLTAFKV